MNTWVLQKLNQKYIKFGIYRSYLSKWIYSPRNKKKEKGVPAQVVYFDEVRTGKTKEKVVGNLK